MLRHCRWIFHRPPSRKQHAQSSRDFGSARRLVVAETVAVSHDVAKMMKWRKYVDTLMSHPLARLNRFGPGTKRHEVSLHDVLCVGRIEPQRQWLGQMVGIERFLGRARHTN